jgi:hypothetical protein
MMNCGTLHILNAEGDLTITWDESDAESVARARRSFCIHPESGHGLPGADIALTQMLWLAADEEAFLAEANATERHQDLWNGDYLRRLRQHRTAESEQQS